MTSTGWGGLEMNTLKLIVELQQLGYALEVIVQSGSRFDVETQKLGLSVTKLKRIKKYFDFANAKRIARLVNENGLHAILVPYRPDLDVVAWAKRKCTVKPKVIHQQHMQIGVPKKGWLQRMRYKAIDTWIAPLNWLRDEVIEKTVVPGEKIVVAPIGVRSGEFLSRKYSREDARELMGCESNAQLIGVLGRIDEKKGQLFLVQALEQIRTSGEELELLIVGEPTINDPRGKAYYDQLMCYIADHQLESVVHFAGFTQDVARFYNAIDVFVMSSIGETYGMVTLEAMLSGVPVLGTDSGGTPEILGRGRLGELYVPENMDAFLAAYNRLQQRLKSGELDVEAIRTEIAEKFDLSKEIGEIARLLDA